MRQTRIGALVLCIVAVLSACSPKGAPPPDTQAVLFYAKDGSVYVSAPPGTPGRKVTGGPGDTQPAPSPDGSRLAFVRKADRADGGGELMIVDLGPDHTAASPPRRLVDPSSLVPVFAGERPQASTPRFSPTGNRIAFLKTAGGGGFLLTADAANGAVSAPPKPLYADTGYAWAPDGNRIAWVGGRSDVSPVDVNVLTVGGASTPVATDTNAFAATYDADGRSVIFTNGEATGTPFSSIPFALRKGGIYAVDPTASPAALFTGDAAYADIQALASGDVGFTQYSADQRLKTVYLMDRDRRTREVAQTPSDAPAPVWSASGRLAYVGSSGDRPLLVADDGDDLRVDAGVDSFAWGQTGG